MGHHSHKIFLTSQWRHEKCCLEHFWKHRINEKRQQTMLVNCKDMESDMDERSIKFSYLVQKNLADILLMGGVIKGQRAWTLRNGFFAKNTVFPITQARFPNLEFPLRFWRDFCWGKLRFEGLFENRMQSWPIWTSKIEKLAKNRHFSFSTMLSALVGGQLLPAAWYSQMHFEEAFYLRFETGVR